MNSADLVSVCIHFGHESLNHIPDRRGLLANTPEASFARNSEPESYTRSGFATPSGKEAPGMEANPTEFAFAGTSVLADKVG